MITFQSTLRYIKNWFVGDILATERDEVMRVRVEMAFWLGLVALVISLVFVCVNSFVHMAWGAWTSVGCATISFLNLFFIKFLRSIRLPTSLFAIFILAVMHHGITVSRYIDVPLMVWEIIVLFFVAMLLGNTSGLLVAGFLSVQMAFFVYRPISWFFPTFNAPNIDNAFAFSIWLSCTLAYFFLIFMVDFFSKTILAANRELGIRNATLTGIIESTHSSVYAVDTEYRYTVYNSFYQNLMGKSMGIAVERGGSLYENLDTTHANYIQVSQSIDRAMNGEYHSGLVGFKNTFHEVTFNPIFGQQDAILGVAVFATDVTPRILAEQQLQESKRALAEAQQIAHLGSWIIDWENDFLEWSDENYRIHGVTREEYTPKVYDNYLNHFVHPDDRDIVLSVLGGELITEEVHFHYRILRQDTGEVRHLDAVNRIYTSREGKLTRSIGTLLDVTEARQNEESLRQSEQLLTLRAEELERSNSELERFAYITSHDLREPIRTTLGLLQTIARRYGSSLDSIGIELLDNSITTSQRMSQLVDGVLTFSRIGRVNVETTNIDFNTLLKEILHDLEQRIYEKQAAVRIDRLPTLAVHPLEIKQVFQNFISNGLKFSDNSRLPLIQIKVVESGKFWQFSVSDNGIGIDMKYSHDVFQMFKRLNPFHMYEGSGLGLSICKKIIERNGGQVWFRSEVGQGTTFYFTLPKASHIPHASTVSIIAEA